MNSRLSSYYLSTIITLLLISCGRPVQSLFKDGVVKGTDVGEELLKKSLTTFEYDTLKGDELEIAYLGCGGFNIKRGEQSVLIDPYFSHQPVLFRLLFSKLGFRTIKSDLSTIDAELGKYYEKGEKASSIWITHSHYDHLMDVPYVFENYTNRSASTVFCSQSGANIIRGVDSFKPNHVVALDSKVNIPERYYVADSTIRVTPILSEHAPHLFWNIKFFKGDAKQHKKYNRSDQKSRADWWKEGMTFSFLYDFLDASGDIEFRMFVQSSASTPEIGFIPTQLKAEHGVDLAILGAASYSKVNNYPDSLLSYMSPKRLIICHWEDFFVKYNRKKKRTVRFTNIKKCIQAVNAEYKWKVDGVEKFILPYPGTVVKIREKR